MTRDYDFTNTRINYYHIIKLIGTGAYGLVFLVENTLNHKVYAMKVISKKIHSSVVKQSERLANQLHAHLSEFQCLNQLDLPQLASLSSIETSSSPYLRELNLHLRLHNHPNVITIHQVLDSSIAVFVIMDYYPEGDLFTNIVDNARYINSNIPLIKKIFIQLVDVIQYCHSKGIYHCDIKPENIMCDGNGEFLVIGDFGLSTTERFMNSHKCIGSSYYMPPERLISMEKKLYKGKTTALDEDICYPSEMGDLWSLSIILINLTCMRNPWNKACGEMDHTFKTFLSNPKVLKDILPISNELYEILIKCLKQNPFERITIKELKRLVMLCPKFTTEGPLSIEQHISVKEDESLNARVEKSESTYLSSSTSEVDSINSYDHSDHYEMDDVYDIELEQTNVEKIQNTSSIIEPHENKLMLQQFQAKSNVNGISTLHDVANYDDSNYSLNIVDDSNSIVDNYSIATNFSFNMNYNLQKEYDIFLQLNL